jgi:ADP-ribosylglycohydrolase
MGTLIGDALGLGCHWYYDLEAMRADYGDWISDYTDQKPDRTDRFGYIAKYRHEYGIRAGDISQTGELIVMLMDSVAACGGYDEDDYTARLDSFLQALDGTDLCGRFTDRAVRNLWQHRKLGLPWSEAGSSPIPPGRFSDTSEAAQRAVVIAALCDDDYEAIAKKAYSNIRLTHRDRYISGYSLSFALAAASMINGNSLLEDTDRYLQQFYRGRIGLHRPGHLPDDQRKEDKPPHLISLAHNPAIEPMLAGFDNNKQIYSGFTGADPSIEIDPRDACCLFGLDCSLGFLAPAAYFLIQRFPDDFEKAVLNAVNAGGNCMARGALTGALSGAMVGIQGIPERFITGLKDHERLLGLAEQIAGGEPQITRKAS